MLFHTSKFLGFFLVVFVVYWLLPRSWRKLRLGWLLYASAWFYLGFTPVRLLLLLAFSTSVDCLAALLLDRTQSPLRRRLILAASLSINLGILIYFKYVNFFFDTPNQTATLFGLPLDLPTRT